MVGTDRGVPKQTSERMIITVHVDDVNDNKPYFPADKQLIKVSVEEEKEGVSVGSVDFAQDDDDRQLFCYSIIGK